MAQLPVVNAIENQTEKADENRETLQRSFRGSLGALGTKMKAQTNVLTGIAVTMDAAYNIDQQQLLVDAENRLEKTRKDQAEADQKAKEGKIVSKVKGGLLATLKKAFLGGVIIGAVSLVMKHWDTIKSIFEWLAPKMKKLASIVGDLSITIGKFLLENIESIGVALFAIWAGKKLATALGAMKKGFNALVDGYKGTRDALVNAKNKMVDGAKSIGSGAKKLAAGAKEMGAKMAAGAKNLIASAKNLGGKLVTNIPIYAKRLKVAIVTTSTNLLSSAKSLASAAKSKILKWAKMLAAGVMALPALLSGAAASLAPVLIAAAPIIAAGAAIGLVLFGMKKAFDDMQATFADTGSIGLTITEGLSTLFATIVGFVPDLLKSATSWILGKLGFEDAAESLDSFSITDFIQNGISGIFDNLRILFMKAINGIIGIVNSTLDWIPGFGAETISPAFDIAAEEAMILKKNVAKEDRRAAADVEEEEVPKKKASGFDTLSPLAKARLEASGQRPDTRSAIEPRKDPMDGSQVNARSSKAGAAAGNIVVTTVAPTNISAPTSTSVSSQTNISPGAVRRRRPMRARMAQSYS
jgi:hypothetical protein